MTDKPPEDEPGAEDRFQRGIANALKMPPKPHKALVKDSHTESLKVGKGDGSPGKVRRRPQS